MNFYKKKIIKLRQTEIGILQEKTINMPAHQKVIFFKSFNMYYDIYLVKQHFPLKIYK